jgi:hypothetical protein
MRPRLLRFFSLAAVLVIVAPHARAQASANLTGRVIDASTRQPIAAAQIVITAASRMAITAENGTFSVQGLAAGTHLVAVRRIGYAARQDTVQLRAGETRRIEIALAPQPVPLPEVAVAGERGYLGGFWERRATTQGHFFTRDDILRRNPTRLVEMFQGVPGAKVIPTGRGHAVGTMRGARTLEDPRRAGTPTGECAAAVFLDGMPYQMTFAGLNEILLDHVAAVEYYSSPARIPAQFNVTGRSTIPESGQIHGDPRCGVIVIWTRGQQ